ncbi:hypothetical protein [Nocardia sp. NBC_01329]|uniref:hypothetical protein n=1 Tax=Nocardia sp. NBC_01329 TaxID=2903594 RepID=UPI002E0D8BDC|nr:hypothetical protein OG405_11145 [Nocardia sp. NBC_01329]
MRSTVRRRVIALIGAAAIGCAVPVATATAQPTYYDPEIGHCGHPFRAPPDAPRAGAAVYRAGVPATGHHTTDSAFSLR